MSLVEVERWLTEYIVGVHHAKQHCGIHTTPLHRWTARMIGDPQAAGTVTQRRAIDEERFRLDFLPFVDRTIQPYGIAIDGIRYYGDVLRLFIGATIDGRKRNLVASSRARPPEAAISTDTTINNHEAHEAAPKSSFPGSPFRSNSSKKTWPNRIDNFRSVT